MPNLVGLWRQSANEGEVLALLGRQIASIQSGFLRYAEYRMTQRHWGAALLDHGLLENGIQPGISTDDRWQVLLDGEVLNLADLVAQLRPSGRAKTSQGAICAALIGARGLSIVEQFNGAFVLVVWDSQEQQLHLITDRLGVRPLFVRCSTQGVTFASELKGILAASDRVPSVDPVAIYEQLVYGVHFRGRTWLEGAERLQPATVLTLSRSGISSRCYWKYKYRYCAKPLSQEAYALRFAVLLDRAVERCMRGSKRVGIFLSGGYDSRSVAASIRPHHLPIVAYTFGELASRDMQIAPVLAQRLGLTHAPLPPQRPYLYPNSAAVVWRTEGLMSFANATSVQFHDLMSKDVDIFLTGFLGEFSGSHTWPALLLARSRKAIIKAIYNRFVAPRIDRARLVLRSEIFDRAHEEACERFMRSFEDIDNDSPMDVADAWNFTFLQPGGTFHAPSVDRHRLEMRAPHIDRDLVDFLMTIPPSARIEQRVYKRMIAGAFPRIKDVPCANSMQPIEPRFWLEYPMMAARLASRKAFSPVMRLLGREDRLGREFSDLDADIRCERELDSRVVRPSLAQHWLDDRVFSFPGIEKIADMHFDGAADHGVVLAQVMSLGLASRMLLQGDISNLPTAYRAPMSNVS